MVNRSNGPGETLLTPYLLQPICASSRLDQSLLQPEMLPLEHFLRPRVRVRVLVAPEIAELGLDPAPRLAAEQIRERHGMLAGARILLEEHLRPRAGRRHGKELAAH